MTPSVDFIATYFTLAGNVLPMSGVMKSPIPLAERARAAARAGYAGIGLGAEDLSSLVDRHGYAGVRRIIADSGLRYLELEALLDWFADGERRRASDTVRSAFLDAAEQLGAYQIKVVGDLVGGLWPMSRLSDEFRILCGQAADVGTQVTIEPLPFSSIRDPRDAAEIVGEAGAPNGGILLDIWHLARAGFPYEDISSLPPRFIKHIELDDADEKIQGTLFEDTINNRLLPGEGGLDVRRFIQCAQAAGYKGPYGVEILSHAHRALPLAEAAERSLRAARSQFG